MQPPTDNLYKFIAIFGLIIVGFSIYVPLQRLDEFGRSSMQADVAYQPIIDRTILVDDAARADLVCAISQAQKREGVNVANPDACANALAAKAIATEAGKDLVALRAKVRNLEYERNFLYQQYRRYSVLGVFAGILGVGLCIAGFWLWYVRLQRHLDAAAKTGA